MSGRNEMSLRSSPYPRASCAYKRRCGLSSRPTIRTSQSEKTKMKKALIMEIAGRDGACLTEFLLNKGCAVHGINQRPLPSNLDVENFGSGDKNETKLNLDEEGGA